MKLVIKENKVIATHDDNQEIENLSDYSGCQFITEQTGLSKVGDDYEVTQEGLKTAIKANIQSQIDEFDIKRIRAIAEGGNYQAETTWLDYYTSEIQKLRQELIALG